MPPHESIRTKVQGFERRSYAASRSPAGKRIIARHCDCWFVEYAPDLAEFEQKFERIRQDVAEMRDLASAEGRCLSFGLSAHVICEDTEEEAAAAAGELVRYGAKDRIALICAKAMGAGLVGSHGKVAARIEAHAGIGVDRLMLRFHPMLAGLERFADRVLPLLDPLIRPPSPGSARAASAAKR